MSITPEAAIHKMTLCGCLLSYNRRRHCAIRRRLGRPYHLPDCVDSPASHWMIPDNWTDFGEQLDANRRCLDSINQRCS